MLLVSHDRALLDAVAHRTLAIEDETIRSFDGGWTDYVRRRDELAAPVKTPEPKPKAKPKPPAPRQDGPSELDRVEADIAEREQAIAELEQRLADDWGDAEILAAHRAARDELQGLLARWERLFEEAKV